MCYKEGLYVQNREWCCRWLLVFLAVGPVWANLVSNSGFETPTVTSNYEPGIDRYFTGNGGSVTLGDWTVSGTAHDPESYGSLVYLETAGQRWSDTFGMFTVSPQEGSQYFLFGMVNGSSGNTTLSQTISTVPGQKYTVTFQMASAYMGYSSVPSIKVKFGDLDQTITAAAAASTPPHMVA